MKPQSKITIFMVVMIVMLSIYYFTLNRNDTKDTGKKADPQNTQVFRYEEYELLRTQLRESRQEMIANLQAQIVSASDNNKRNQAMTAINEILTRQNNEYSFEIQLRKLGYLDAFVSSNEGEVTVRVLDKEASVAEANAIIKMGKAIFGVSTRIKVTFDTEFDENEMY